jgi:hypothetical protein
MKVLICALLVLVALGGILVWATRPQPARESQLTEPPAGTLLQTSPTAEPATIADAASTPQTPATAPVAPASKPASARPPAPGINHPLDVTQAIGALVDPRTTHTQQEVLWKQLLDSGKLDETIAALERRISENPNAPADLSRLGHAYLLKAGTTKDYSELASLGMKIDQTLDQSLKLDSNSWEARFDKADSMSYWPSYLGKDKEVVERFLALIQDQETQAPQPHFAQTYLKLGEKYAKLGHADYAHEIWQRGAGWFPQDQTLQDLAARQSQ